MACSLMVQGTSSDAGKSILVTGLCRVLHRRGIRVAPFKPQNMSLNSAVTPERAEIGRAQALQAQAAGIAPHSDMNPVLLKPCTDTEAQVIIHGQVALNLGAAAYHDYKRSVLPAVMASWQRLCAAHDCVVVEGAGSPAEINLRERDIANMGFAEEADCPVILVADIDRGGVFAHLVGTLELLSAGERDRVRGFVINRFRGDPGLLRSGLEWLQERTGKPVFGVLPYLPHLQLDAEDAIDTGQQTGAANRLQVVVPALPRIANHTDFDALRSHPRVDLHYIPPGRTPPPADLVILPGSKQVRADLAWLREQGWAPYLQRHLRYGGRLLGICGGFQMLGLSIDDPHGVEGPPGRSEGLGWLPVHTTLARNKTLRQAQAFLPGAFLPGAFLPGAVLPGAVLPGAVLPGAVPPGACPLSGYEIHCGDSVPAPGTPPFALRPDGRTEGARSEDDLVAGTYLHGLFDTAPACDALLAWAGLPDAASPDRAALREAAIDRLADCLEQHLDLARLLPRWCGAA